MNARQRRAVRRECARTMFPGTEVLLGNRRRRGRYGSVTVVSARVDAYGVPWVVLEDRYDFGRQIDRAEVRFTTILAYRKP